MTREILSLKLNRKKVANSTDNQTKINEPPEAAPKAFSLDPQKRFLKGVAIHPSECIQLTLGSTHPTMRAMDLFTPIGKGQRGLIVAPPGCGKTTILKNGEVNLNFLGFVSLEFLKPFIPTCELISGQLEFLI